MNTVCLRTCDVIGGVVVMVVWDVVDPAARTVGSARRALRRTRGVADADRRRLAPVP